MPDSSSSLDIPVAVVSRDPFFLFATRGLLGRDRAARIVLTVGSLAELARRARRRAGRIAVVVCDVDSVDDGDTFYERLAQSVEDEMQVLCLVEGRLDEAAVSMADIPVRALIAKSDLHFALHLVIKAIDQHPVTLISEAVGARLEPGTYLHDHGRTIRPRKPHPDITERQEEVMMLRVFIGLDNPDIGDELQLSDYTIREHVSEAYRGLAASSELDVFDALSDWWWTTRFLQALME